MSIISVFTKWTRFLVLVIFMASCENNDNTPLVDPAPSIEYMIFGHLDGFCNKCDILYKIEDGQLYTTKYQQQIDPKNPQFILLPASAYDSVRTITTQVPPALFNVKTETIGSYFPDVGHYYVEIKHDTVVQRWYIEGNNVPDYLKTFLAGMNTALAILK